MSFAASACLALDPEIYNIALFKGQSVESTNCQNRLSFLNSPLSLIFNEIGSKKFLLNFSRVFSSDTNILSVNDNGSHVPGFKMAHFRRKTDA